MSSPTPSGIFLPPATRQALDYRFCQVTQHDLIFNRWGLGDRHPTGLALAFNFAGKYKLDSCIVFIYALHMHHKYKRG